MGVLLTDVTPALQRSLSLGTSRGALVQDVTAGSPAERAGVRAYDVIVDVEGRDIGSNEELIRDISARQPGTVARLGVAARHPQGDDSGQARRAPDARRFGPAGSD